ncbi:MAG TPA: hypothetical protein VHU14_09105 [Solirubrobacterales bacterium]|nr:hypothetical protein [Solirubrobacterales bacterium]
MKRRWPILTLGAAIVVSTLLILYLGRGQTPLVDQWAYIYAYRSWAPNSLATPHSGHLIILPLLVYKAMFSAFGLESQLPYQLVNLALSATVAVLLFALTRDAVGDILALFAAILTLFFGAGADVIVPTFQITNLIGLAAGLGMLLALRREDVRGDVAACLLLATSLASFSIGVAFAAGAVAMLTFRPRGLRLSRWWVVVPPLVLYTAWAVWARKFGEQTVYVHNLKVLGSALFDQLGAALAAITGLFTTPNGPPPDANPVPIRTVWGPALVVGLAALLILRLRRPPRPGRDAVAAVAVLVVYYLLVGIALNKYRNTFDTRLVYLGSVLVLLAVAQLLAPFRPSQAVLAAVGIAFLFSLCANIAELSDSAHFIRAQSASVRAKLAAVELAGAAAAPKVLVEKPPGAMSFDVEAFHQLDADFGMPDYSEAELRAAPAAARETADEELVRILEIAPSPGGPVKPFRAPGGIAVQTASNGEVKRKGACVALHPRRSAQMEALVRLPPGGMAYASAGSPATVSLGRFADAPEVSLPPSSGPAAIHIPADAGSADWMATVRTSVRTVVCPVHGLA